jgi:predicted dehydrogenase
MSPDSPIRFGIIGAGGRAAEYFGPRLKKICEARLVSLADTNPVRLEAAGRILGGGLELYRDYRELLRSDELDAVVVATPDSTHAELATAAFNAGLHVLCEKPLATTVAGCERILEAARRVDKKLEVGFVLRYVPFFQRLREVVGSGALGAVHLIEASDYYRGGASYFRRWNRLREVSGGLLVHKGTHTFDIINWIVGAKPLRAATFGGNDVFVPDPTKAERCRDCTNRCLYYVDITKGRQRELWLEAEGEDGYIRDVCLYNSEKSSYDNSVSIVLYENGTKLAYVECFFSTTSSRRFRMVGDKGELFADQHTLTIELWDMATNERKLIEIERGAGDHGMGSTDQVSAFVGSILGRGEAMASGEAGLASVAVGEACERSALEGRMVDVEL